MQLRKRAHWAEGRNKANREFPETGRNVGGMGVGERRVDDRTSMRLRIRGGPVDGDEEAR